MERNESFKDLKQEKILTKLITLPSGACQVPPKESIVYSECLACPHLMMAR